MGRHHRAGFEANIKGLGVLLFLGAAGLILTGLVALNAREMAATAVGLLAGGVLGLSAYWLRRLDPRGA